MTIFEKSLYDGSDPAYAPCTGISTGLIYWKAPSRYRKAGYALKSRRLAGKPGDGLDLQRAAMARELTRDMIRWYDGEEGRVLPGTWGGLIAHYKGDDISPMQEVQPNTREAYLHDLGYWEPVLGHTLVEDFTYQEAKTIERAMQAKGRSRHFIKAKFTMLRIVAGYGLAIKWSGAREVREVLGQLRLKSPKPRSSSPTEAQVLAIVRAADEAGDTGLALGLLIQWRLALRAMDVRGDYFRLRKGEERSGICRGNFRWGKGLTWDMIDRDVTTLTKTPSKTDDAMPEALVWDLTLVPDVRERLLTMEKRVGPVITDKSGMPYRKDTWSDRFRVHRKAAEVPETIWMMDTRAGAINDAKNKGATKIQMQQQANHASGETTERYIREKSDGVNNVLRLRAERS